MMLKSNCLNYWSNRKRDNRYKTYVPFIKLHSNKKNQIENLLEKLSKNNKLSSQSQAMQSGPA